MESKDTKKNKRKLSVEEITNMRTRLTERKKVSDYNIFNQIFFFWVSPLIEYCNRSKELHFDMMNNLEDQNKYKNYANKIDYYFEQMKESYSKQSKPNFKTFYLKLIFKAFGWDYSLQVFCGLILSAFTYSTSFCVQKIFEIQYLPVSDQEKMKLFALYTCLMVVFKTIYIIANNQLNFYIQTIGLKTFYATSHLVLKKTMKTSFTQNTKYNIGEIINLGTVDSQRFLGLTFYFLYLISGPFTIVFGLTYIWLLIGWPLVPALFCFLILMVVNILIIKKGLLFQKMFMKIRSQRVKLTSEIFSNIKFVKSYSLETFFIKKIMDIRSEELRWLSYIFYRLMYSIANSSLSPGLFLLVLFSVYVAAGYNLTAGKIFTTISIFNSFVGVLTYLPNLFSNFIDIMISSERLTKFLLSPDIESIENKYKDLKMTKLKVEGEDTIDYSVKEKQKEINLFDAPFYLKELQKDNEENTNVVNDSEFDIQIKNYDFCWTKFWMKNEDENEKKDEKKESKKEINSENSSLSESSQASSKTFRLKNINLEIKQGEFVCIIGKSGSGKSSLFLSILGELFAIKSNEMKNIINKLDNESILEENMMMNEDEENELNYNPHLSFLSQKPWIRNATLKENILFGSEYEEEKYLKCIKYSGLEDDLKILLEGDATIIGDKGINLSGGQKVRVALARAFYNPSEMFLFDDPLSALDVNVGNLVFHKGFKEFLKGRTRLIITHNLGYLKHFNRILFMDQGEIVYDGSYENIQTKPFYIGNICLIKRITKYLK